MTRPLRFTSAIQERMWAIPVTSEHPEKAMQFLNLLYSDDRVANLLSNGVENVRVYPLWQSGTGGSLASSNGSVSSGNDGI